MMVMESSLLNQAVHHVETAYQRMHCTCSLVPPSPICCKSVDANVCTFATVDADNHGQVADFLPAL